MKSLETESLREDQGNVTKYTEEDLNDIEGEYPMLYRLQAKAKECGDDTVSFDKFVGQHVEHKDGLLESLKDGHADTHEEKIIDALLCELFNNCGYSKGHMVEICRDAGMTDEEINAFVIELD